MTALQQNAIMLVLSRRIATGQKFFLLNKIFNNDTMKVLLSLKSVIAPFCIFNRFGQGGTSMKKHEKLLKMILSALFLAIAYVLPFFTGQIPEIGAMLLPMHIPVLLCGFICGAPWGLVVGFAAPLLRSFVLGMPPLFPTAVCMAFELATYGFIAGLMHKILSRKKMYIYCSLIVSMIIGRIVWGVAMVICMGVTGGAFTFAAFMAGAITNAIPGIIVQVILIPVLVMVLDKQKKISGIE